MLVGAADFEVEGRPLGPEGCDLEEEGTLLKRLSEGKILPPEVEEPLAILAKFDSGKQRRCLLCEVMAVEVSLM